MDHWYMMFKICQDLTSTRRFAGDKNESKVRTVRNNFPILLLGATITYIEFGFDIM